MESNWAADNLQVIRTLMERSAVYRRALAPVMMTAGLIGIAASLIPTFNPIHAAPRFVAYWLVVGVVAVTAAFLLVRRQALKDAEPFWSPPTRRVAQALLPAFLAGLVFGAFFASPYFHEKNIWILPPLWMIAYGLGLHGAGFFMQRGIRLFGLIFVAAGCALLLISTRVSGLQSAQVGHGVMGTFFGLAHLAAGAYFYVSEKRKNTA